MREKHRYNKCFCLILLSTCRRIELKCAQLYDLLFNKKYFSFIKTFVYFANISLTFILHIKHLWFCKRTLNDLFCIIKTTVCLKRNTKA